MRRSRHDLTELELSAPAFILVLALAFANGTNDVSKAVVPLVGSGVSDYRTASARGTVWTMAGAIASTLVASAMVKTFGHGLIQTPTPLHPAGALAVSTGAMAWVLIASRTGFPILTTHALTGAIVGACLQELVVGLDTIHWLSSGLASFARSMNDAPKIVALLLLGSATAIWPSLGVQYTPF